MDIPRLLLASRSSFFFIHSQQLGAAPPRNGDVAVSSQTLICWHRMHRVFSRSPCSCTTSHPPSKSVFRVCEGRGFWNVLFMKRLLVPVPRAMFISRPSRVSKPSMFCVLHRISLPPSLNALINLWLQLVSATSSLIFWRSEAMNL